MDTIEITEGNHPLWEKGQRGVVTRMGSEDAGVMAAFNGDSDWYVAPSHYKIVY